MLYNLLRSDDWRLAHSILQEQVIQLDSISSIDNLENTPFDQLGQITAARAGALAIINNWLGDLEARAGNFVSIVEGETEEEGFVKHR